MSFINTGFRELTLKFRRQRTRLALRHEKRVLKKSEITLGREGTSEAAKFPEVRAEIVALRKLEQEQKEFTARIAQIEEALKQIEQQRQENSRAAAEAIAKLEDEKRPLVERRDAAKVEADNCGKAMSAAERRVAAHEATDKQLLQKLSALQELEPPPDDLAAQMETIARQRAELPDETAQLIEARATSTESCRAARERLAAEDALVGQADKNIAKVRGEFEARDRALNESSRSQQEEVRAARQQHQTVEEKKNPAYLNIGRHLADAGIAPPNAPHLLADVQRRRAAVERHAEHTRELAEISGGIDKQELRKFYFALFSIVVLLVIVVPLALQSPAKRDWLPQDTGTLFFLDPAALGKNALVKAWQKEQPEMWGKVFAGLAGPATRTPALDLAKDASRVTRALVREPGGREREYVLVETGSDIAPTLRAITQDDSFNKSTVNGLVIFQRPDVTVARVGPRTLAVGSLGAVDQLVQVRLGTEPDLKVDDPLWKEVQSLEGESTIRLAARDPGDLPRLFGPIFTQELLDAAQLLGFAVVLDKPSKAHLFVRTKDSTTAKELAAGLTNDPGRWLTLPGSDFILSGPEPKIDQSGADLDLHFEIPEGAARLLLQRLAKVQPAPIVLPSATPSPSPTPTPAPNPAPGP
ncbi:MAG: hypothetical protein ACR2MW_01300 [Chthoniobacterales bacterium]